MSKKHSQKNPSKAHSLQESHPMSHSISSISTSLETEKASHFSLEKTKRGLRLIEENHALPEIVCRSLHKGRATAKQLKEIENKQIVIISARSCKQHTDKIVETVAVDVKKLASKLGISKSEAVRLLQSNAFFNRLCLIASVHTLLEAFHLNKDQTYTPIDRATLIKKLSQALLSAINNDIIQTEDDLADAFKARPSKIFMVLSGDGEVHIHKNTIDFHKTFKGSLENISTTECNKTTKAATFFVQSSRS